jgi:hypothetical protein
MQEDGVMSVIEERNVAKGLAHRTVREIINPTTCQVLYDNLDLIHATLTRLGYTLIKRDVYPEGSPGRQLFWRNGLILVRVKTRGDGGGPRKGRPHASVGLTDGQGTGWANDIAKFDATGQLRPKSLGSADRFESDLNSTDDVVRGRAENRKRTHRFEVLLGGKTEGDHNAISDAWADGVHFGFASNRVDDANADNLPLRSDGQPV